jgi:hypothetical protein
MLFANHLKLRGQNDTLRVVEVIGNHVSRDEHNLDDIAPNLPGPLPFPIRQGLASRRTARCSAR